MWRSRWAAIGAAVAVSLGAGGLFVAQAAPGPSESTIVTVTPERILDTRDPVNLGLPGPFTSAVSQKLQVTGSIPTATGTKTVVPTGATGVLLNVTPVNMTANGFISIRPGDATGTATTSSLNFTTGVAGVVPNAVQVAMPTAGANEGEIDITYDAYGQAGQTTDILIDVVGYMTSTGLQELVADVATKANAADVYTKAQSDSTFVSHGSITLSHGTSELTPNQGLTPSSVQNYGSGTIVSGDGYVNISPTGPAVLGGVEYGLSSIKYCVSNVVGAQIDTVRVYAENIGVEATDSTDRTANGCYSVVANLKGAQAYDIQFLLKNGGSLRFTGLQTTWLPASAIPATLTSPTDAAGVDAVGQGG
jgi:hypothetical protein